MSENVVRTDVGVLQGDVKVDGTLEATGATTLTSVLNANGGIACDTDKFTVADATGNVATAGDLAVAGNSTLGDITMTDEKNIVLNATTGSKIGTAATQKLGFFNATPVVQPSGAAQAAVTSQSLNDAADAAYQEADMTKVQTELNDVTALANEMRSVLVNLGLMKGSA